MPSYEIGLLGRFAVRVNGEPVPACAWRHKRAAELVKILALANGHRLHRGQVTDLLWPDLAADAAAGNLRKAIHFARASLGAADAINRSGEMLELGPGGHVLVDALAFEAAARAGQAGALDLYQGELLPEDRYASWAEEPCERLRERLRADLGAGPDRKSVALYERAISMGGPGLPTAAERTHALLARGLVQLNTGELDQAEQTARRARNLAMDAGLGREIGEASSLLGILANLRGEWEERFRTEFAAAVQADPQASAHLFDAHLCLAESCLYGPAGHETMAQCALELRAVAEQAGSVEGRALAQYLLGEAELLSGRLGAAHQVLISAVALYERAGATSGQAMAMHRLAEVAVASARPNQAS